MDRQAVVTDRDPGSVSDPHSAASLPKPTMREVSYADAKYVLDWLRQTNAPPNIIALQERATAYLGVASGR